MSYDLESNEETHRGRPDIAVMKDSAGDVAIGGSDVGEDVKYPTVSVIIPTYTKARWDWLHECVASAAGADRAGLGDHRCR